MSSEDPAGAPQQEDGQANMQDVVVDVRCLQDSRFRDRGIGQHVAALLDGAHRFGSKERRLRFIAGVDKTLPPLEARHRELFEAEQRLTAEVSPGSLFIQMSPMTHSADVLQNIFSRPDVRTIAVVYDFIPLQFAQIYLANEADRSEYLELLGVLGDYDQFISISRSTSECLRELLDIDPERCSVSGVAVRSSIVGSAASPAGNPYCLAVLGEDPRKNVEAFIIAHGRSAALRAAGVGIKVVGHYRPSTQIRLRRLHEQEGGATFIEFVDGLTDRELADAYGQAMVTVCPSRAEGFSIPVVEANANGCPVIVSSCPAQSELLPLADFQFGPDDYERLRHLLEAFLDPAFAERAIAKQQGFWRHYDAVAVQERFWRAALHGIAPPNLINSGQAPFISRGALPRLAIASPVPPDRSGVADYTLATMKALAERADLDLYTETRGRLGGRTFASVQALSSEPFRRRRHDAIISVVGNSHFHLAIFNLLLQYGGACVAHDARMVHFYAALLGRERTLGVATRELGRPVNWSEVEGWLANQRTLPTSFLSEILDASQPTFVHSPVTQGLIEKQHHAKSVHLPFAVYRELWPEFQGQAGRARARELLGFGHDEKILISLGDLIDDKAITECVWTAAMLLSWGVRLRLVLAGKGDPAFTGHIQNLVDSIGIGAQVQISQGHVDERTYQALLMAADAAIQFRTYGLGGLSGALLDEIAAGLPAVVNTSLAAAMEAPSYIAAVPDGISPLLAAEQLAAIFEQPGRVRHEAARREFVAAHSTKVYAERMLEGLGLA